MKKLSREDAWNLFLQYNKDEAYHKHALAVEGVMRHFAQLLGEDEEIWGVVGLLHDLDYEMYPEEHCIKAQEIMNEAGIDPFYSHAVASHGYGICCDVKPEHVMEKVLYTIDELTGLVTATAIMRPSKSVMDLEVKSLKKKFKSTSFAAKIDRGVIQNGCDMLGMELSDVMEQTIQGMRKIAPALGLAGEEA